ncbi:sigma-54 interaction domain-containing protein [Fusibacter sp. JL298sf-3]
MEAFLTPEQTQKMLDHISDGIQIIDASGRLIYCNRHSAMLDDINISEAIGRHITEVYPSLIKEESTLLKVLKTQSPIYNREQTYRTYKGKEIATVNTTLPIVKSGQIQGAIEISRDVTAYKELSERYLDLQSSIRPQKGDAVEPARAQYRFQDIITENAEFNRVKSIAMKAARTDIPILIYGETGTGKELLTQSIHNASKRASRPFIAQNCAALPASLLEGILFGTVKGGFTGAVDRMGLFELADRGTLFLDEINSMPMELQAKLLRVLQDGKIRRIGDTKERRVDVRIIAATNVEPNAAIEKGYIRRDLYYRLNTVLLWIPKLSDRREDIPVLTAYFIKKYNGIAYRHVKSVSAEVMDLFLNYPWEGNVRELEHVIEGAVTFSESPVIELEELPYAMRKSAPQAARTELCVSIDADKSLKAILEQAEEQAVRDAFQKTGQNVSQTAKLLKMPRQTLQYKLKKYNLVP